MGAPRCDIDDGFALAFALGDPEITVDQVTTVCGNTDVQTATDLTLDMLQRLHREEIPVYRGASVPLVRPTGRSSITRTSGAMSHPTSDVAAVAMLEHVLTHPGEITVVALGPLTNVALAMRLDSHFIVSLKRLIIMGGVFDKTTNRLAMPGEFNVWCDPEAAHIVLSSPVIAWWVGLDVTEQVRLTRDSAEKMTSSNRWFEAFAGECATSWMDHLKHSGLGDGESCALHDPLAVAAVVNPDLLAWSDASIRVETGELMRGATLAEYAPTTTPANDEKNPSTRTGTNAHVARAVDSIRFTELLFERIRGLP